MPKYKSPSTNFWTSNEKYRTTLRDLDQLLKCDRDRTVYVNFDYTLFLYSSTKEFIKCGQPAVALQLLRSVLNLLGPRIPGKEKNGRFQRRDVVLVWVILLCMPWTLWLFGRRAPRMFAQSCNKELMELLNVLPGENIIVISAGYESLIRALLKDSSLSGVEVVGSSFWRPLEVHRSGKLARLRQAGFEPEWPRDIVVTDTLEDHDLLNSVDAACLILPQGNSTSRTSNDSGYVPFLYTAKVKRSVGFVTKQMFAEELVLVLLATVLFYPFSLTTWLSATCLFVAYLIAYEIGYAENDRRGVKVELDPKLGDNYHLFQNFQLEPAAWFWVAAFCLAGVLLLNDQLVNAAIAGFGLPVANADIVNTLLLGAVWILLILIGRGLFFLFNNIPLVLRVFFYVPLHVSKYFSLIVIFPTQAVGYALLSAQIMRTWSLYAIRRSGGDIEKIASQSIRLIFFVLILFTMVLYLPDQKIFLQWQTWLILGFCLVRAAPEARRKLFSTSALQSGMRIRKDTECEDSEESGCK